MSDELDEDSSETLKNELLRISIIDRISKKLTRAHLEDEGGNVVELKSVVHELLSFVNQKLSDVERNSFTTQLLPLLAQTCTIGLIDVVGPEPASIFLTEPTIRETFIQMMSVSFLLLKLIQQKKLTIVTEEEDVSEEDIAKLDRLSAASSVMTQGMMAGLNPTETLQMLKDAGKISDEDIQELQGKIKKTDEE